MTVPDAADEPVWPADEIPVGRGRGQGVTPILSSRDLDALAHPELWDSDADYDAFLADLYAARRTDAG